MYLGFCGDTNLSYQLELRRQRLRMLCYAWQCTIRSLCCSNAPQISNLPEWGPSDDELLDVNILEHEGLWDNDLVTVSHSVNNTNIIDNDGMSDVSDGDGQAEVDARALAEQEGIIQLLEACEMMEYL